MQIAKEMYVSLPNYNKSIIHCNWSHIYSAFFRGYVLLSRTCVRDIALINKTDLYVGTHIFGMIYVGILEQVEYSQSVAEGSFTVVVLIK